MHSPATNGARSAEEDFRDGLVSFVTSFDDMMASFEQRKDQR
eukprot:CAMPEP_0116114594 /NCGR_PEP_ID=MMETSP0329-20121206/62_1 /TAXON_ID=697910 /ORGANISM="Pseudo-nitzschia arenysensis, Strain B593" /LENGTH=41 /DNA_ID= /DNA_START= /DNA_END= /DNA_ORIENTATION=